MTLNCDGMVRIERGFIRPEDERPGARPSKRARPELPVIPKVETARRCSMRTGKVRALPAKKMTTAPCRIFLFVTSRRTAPWDYGSI